MDSPKVNKPRSNHFSGAVRRADGEMHTMNQDTVLTKILINGIAATRLADSWEIAVKSVDIFERVGWTPNRTHDKAVTTS